MTTSVNRPAFAPLVSGPAAGTGSQVGSPNWPAVAILCVYLVIRFSTVHDVLLYRFGLNSRYSYWCVPVLFFCAFMSGRVLRVVGSRPGLWMTAFLLWMAACIPASYWRAGSLATLKGYLQNHYLIFLVVGSLVALERPLRSVLSALVIAMSGFVLSILVFGGISRGGRFTLDFGTYGNPNDIACHLLYLAPLAAFALLPPRGAWRSCIAALALALGVIDFFRTGSRGGLLALCMMLLAGFFLLPASKKLAAGVLALVLVAVSGAALPKVTLARYATMFSDEVDAEGIDALYVGYAEGSTMARKAALRESIRVSLRHPLFGVGPDQYASFTAGVRNEAGLRASWLVTHNAYTQVSSEMGIPGLFIFGGLLVSIFRALRRIRASVRGVQELRAVHRISWCLTFSWIAYCVSAMFASIAYTQYAPLLAGLTVALSASAESQLQALRPAAVLAPAVTAETRYRAHAAAVAAGWPRR